MGILIFHPDIRAHKTNNENHIKTEEYLSEYKVVKSFEWFLKHPFNREIDTMYLNWYENTLKGKSDFIQKIQYFIKKMIIRFVKIRGIKIYYAFHNKTPHNMKKDSEMYQKTVKPFMKFCLKKADKVVILSRKSEEYIKEEFPDVDADYFYLPHGIYTTYFYDKTRLKKRFQIKDGPLFVCLGQISPYKNTDIAVKAFIRSGVKGTILIAGKGKEEYIKELQNFGEENIIIYPKFISDEEYSGMMQLADAAVLPYEPTSMNSGVMINAFSNGTTVIGTKTEMMEEYPENLVYGYSYGSEEEHIEALSDAMKKAEKDYGQLKEKGNLLKEQVLRDNNWKTVKRIIRGEFYEGKDQ